MIRIHQNFANMRKNVSSLIRMSRIWNCAAEGEAPAADPATEIVSFGGNIISDFPYWVLSL